MDAWIQRCPSCGYCAADVRTFDEAARPVLEGAEDRSALADGSVPELASTFICAAILHETAGRLGPAGWSYLHAAWVLDDQMGESDEVIETINDRARFWRSKAADTFTAALASGATVVDQPGGSELILIDCLRRAGRGPEALALIERASKKKYEDVIRKILGFQRSLVNQGDTSGHLISEVFETDS